MQYVVLTFRDSEEAKEHNTIAVGLSNVIVYVADGKVDRPVLVIASSYRHSGLIATKNDGAKD